MPSYNAVLAKYGHAGQQREQAGRAQQAVNRLRQLGQIEDNYARIGEQRDATFGVKGGGHTGYLGEKDYIAGLNRKAEIADLTSRLEGRGGVNVATRRFASPAMSSLYGGAQRPGENATYEGPSDNLDFFGRQAYVQGMDLQNQAASEAITERGLAKLPGVMAERARVKREQDAARMDFERDQIVRNARTAGEAGVAQYAAEQPMRFDKEFDERRVARDRGYFDPKVRQAEIEAETARTDAGRANEAARRGERAAALKALADLAAQMQDVSPTVPGDEIPGTGFAPFRWVGGGNFMEFGRQRAKVPNPQVSAIESAMETARGVLQGGEPSANERSLGMDEIEAFAKEQGISVDEALSLAEQHGYAVR